MLIEANTEFGRRVLSRLQGEVIIWLSTTGLKGSPHPRPVWFYWDGDSFLIFSRPDTRKLIHIANNPAVSLNFNGDSNGGNIIVFSGRADIMINEPPANKHVEYCLKYQKGFQRIGMTALKFADTYSVAIRIWPDKLRGH